MDKTKAPTLFLHGNVDKVTLDPIKIEENKITRKNAALTKSADIVFDGADCFLFNIVEQVSEEIIKWMKNIKIM